MASALTFPQYFRIGYKFGQADQILELEFTKLPETQENYKIRAADRPALAVYDR